MSELNEKILAILDNSISATSWNDQDGLHQEVSGTEQSAKAIEILVLEEMIETIGKEFEMDGIRQIINDSIKRLNQLKQRQ